MAVRRLRGEVFSAIGAFPVFRASFLPLHLPFPARGNARSDGCRLKNGFSTAPEGLARGGGFAAADPRIADIYLMDAPHWDILWGKIKGTLREH
jgi:hypothetical protein